MKSKRCLILANGRAPKKNDINYFMSKGFTDLICADGGCNSAYKLKLLPKLIIGDLDSSDESVIKHFKELGVRIIQYKRQNDTDVEKCVKYVISKKYTEIILCGATGDRLDHSFCNIGVILKFADKIKIYLHHENTIMYSISGRQNFKSHPGELISIYGIDKVARFTSKGLKYPLNETILTFGLKESTSNVAKGDSVSLSVKKGNGLIVRELNMVKKYGLLFNN